MAQYSSISYARLSADERDLERIKSDLDSVVRERDKTRVLVDELLQKVAEAEADITDLTAQRDLLTSSIQRRHATLPLRPLPVLPHEVLGMVFQFSANSYVYAPDRCVQPYRCAQVCRRWRSAALDMASLWAYIGFRYLHGRKAGERWQRLVQHKLLLSGTCPLHVDIWLSDDPNASKYYEEIFSDLMHHCTRWQHFILHGSVFEGTCLQLLALLRGRTPLLESVSFSFAEPCAFPRKEELPDYLPYAPRLTQARFTNVPIVFNQRQRDDSSVLPLMSLAFYDDTYDLASLSATVASFPTLTTLELGWSVCQRDDPEASLPSIRLPELQTLLIHRDNYDESDLIYTSFSLILDSLDLPKLRVLELDPGLVRADCAQGLLLRSAKTLEDLQFCHGSLDGPAPVEILAHLHALRAISFLYTDVSRDFIRALCNASTVAETVIWPKLERLELNNVDDWDFDELLHFLRQRYPINASDPVPYALLEVEGDELSSLMGSVRVAEIQHILDHERERRRKAMPP